MTKFFFLGIGRKKVQSTPKKSFAQKKQFFWNLAIFSIGKTPFWLKLFLGPLFTKIKFISLKSV
jgi:hypothetical protein